MLYSDDNPKSKLYMKLLLQDLRGRRDWNCYMKQLPKYDVLTLRHEMYQAQLYSTNKGY